MPKKPSPSARTTLYRVRGITDLTDAVRPKYLASDSFTATPTTVENSEALLVEGAMHREQASWADRLSRLSGIGVKVGNTTAAALLLIRAAPDHAWALTYGMGFQLLEPTHIDTGFGIRVAVRTAAPDAIQSLTKNEMDYRSRTDRSSIPAGDALRGFGIRDFGEIITRISGSAQLNGLTVGDKDVRIRGADALSVPLAKTPELLMSDLNAIEQALDFNPQPELQVLEQFVRVKSPTKVEELEAKLRAALQGKPTGQLALGWPHERIDTNGTPSSYKLLRTGQHNISAQDNLPTLEVLLEAISQKAPDDLLSGALSLKVLLFRDSDGNEEMSQAIPVINWLFFETTLEGIKYCLFDSCWYEMDTDYAKRLQDHVDEIFSRPPTVCLPDWEVARHLDEGSYNSMAAAEVNGVMLDRQLLRTKQHPRGFEACDIIMDGGALIHVKHIQQSSAISHLIGQVGVSTDALRHDNEARERLRQLVENAGGQPSWLPDRLKSVTLGIARDRPITSTKLLSFSQVTLARLDSSLAEAGIELTISPIKRTQDHSGMSGEAKSLQRRRFVRAEDVVERFQTADPIDYDRFRRDLDRFADQSLTPRG